MPNQSRRAILKTIMTAPPALFDPKLRRARRDRAARTGFDGFLHREVALRLADRLDDVSRAFAQAAVVAAADGSYAAALKGRRGVSHIDQIEESPGLAAAMTGAPGAVSIAPPDAPGLAPETYDLVAFGLALHAVDDPLGALIQARRALRPDGLFLGAALGGETLSELRACLLTAESECVGGAAPRVAPMADIRDWGGLLQRAGFAMPVADCERLTIWCRTPLDGLRDLRATGETNALIAQPRGGLRRDVLMRACALYAERHGRADGKVRATVDVVFLAGWAPAASQPKPLRPGSATARLADALGATERPAGDTADPTQA